MTLATGVALTSTQLSAWVCPGSTQQDFTLPPCLSFSVCQMREGLACALQVPTLQWRPGSELLLRPMHSPRGGRKARIYGGDRWALLEAWPGPGVLFKVGQSKGREAA